MSTHFAGEADRDASRELWVQTVRGAMDAGQKIQTVPARTAKERHKAKQQNYWLSRKSYGGFGTNYDLINWQR
jgi:hypothetical protein